ncbi:MAG TPA: cytochrome c biogenesis protein ResB [Verrucomicrobiae bacterium]|nr:cytochrome c biogenesis protein ResB [Verrucomicrobiae bacterium]
MLIKKTVEFFTSLKLTVTLLAFSVVLVFIGTLAQADEGLYGAQAHYFKQWLVIGAHVFGHKIPLILPGGYLIGMLLLVNLVVAHIYRFELTFKKLGIQLAHAGVILLLVGQLATDMLARELQMHFAEGETRNYSDSATEFELIFQSGNEVTAIPEKMLKSGQELKIENLPFALLVKTNWHNSDLTFRAPMLQNTPPLTPNGIANNFDFKRAEDVKTMDQRNIPTVVLEFTTASGSLGTWVASDWAGDASLVEAVRNSYAQMGADMAQKIAGQLVAPQTIEAGGKKFTFTLRPARAYNPFSLTLLKATHTVYPGTDIPKDFRSRVTLDNPRTGEKREVEISMNHPLRYGGYTYYQYQMDAGQAAQMAGRTPTSVLQVVRNPSWLTPYIGCAMVGAGLVIQFMYHLIGFVSKRKPK